MKKATETLVNAAKQSVTEAEEASSARVKVRVCLSSTDVLDSIGL